MSIVGFVESVSVAQTLAEPKRQRIVPDQELMGPGAANVGAAFTGSFPSRQGLARPGVNFDADVETPDAGIYTAVGVAAPMLVLTSFAHFLSKATLIVRIVGAVVMLINTCARRRTLISSRSDFAAQAATGP